MQNESTAPTEKIDQPHAAIAPAKFPRQGHIHAHDTSISVWEDQVHDSLFSVFAKVCTHMHQRGFTVRACEKTRRHYRRLSRTTRIGAKKALEYNLRLSGRVLELNFFQNLNIQNRSGGEYDFNRLLRMPRPMQLQCLVELRKLADLYLSLGYELGRAFDRDLSLPGAIRFIAEHRQHDDPLRRFNASWDGEHELRRGVHRFERDASGWPTPKEYARSGWPVKDRDGRPVSQGLVKYYRAHDGYLRRATMWGGINGQWMLHSGCGIDCVAAYQVFDCERPDLEPRRLVPKQDERLRAELDRATKQQDWKRVATLAGVLQRTGAIDAATKQAEQKPIAL